MFLSCSHREEIGLTGFADTLSVIQFLLESGVLYILNSSSTRPGLCSVLNLMPITFPAGQPGPCALTLACPGSIPVLQNTSTPRAPGPPAPLCSFFTKRGCCYLLMQFRAINACTTSSTCYQPQQSKAFWTSFLLSHHVKMPYDFMAEQLTAGRWLEHGSSNMPAVGI